MTTTILAAATTSGPSAGVALLGECGIIVRGVFDGALVELELAVADVPEHYVHAGETDPDKSGSGSLSRPGSKMVRLGGGAYFLRAVIRNAGPKTNITVESNYGA